MNIKLKKKLERQAKATEKAMGNYGLSVKKASGTRYATSRLWDFNTTSNREVFKG